MMMNPLPVSSSITKIISVTGSGDGSLTSQRALSIQAQHLFSLRDIPTEMENDDELDSNPVLQQVMTDLKVARQAYGDNDCNVAEAYNALGLVKLHMQNNVQAAKLCHEQALAIYQNKQLAKETAITFADLAYCLERLNRHEDALEKYQQALEIFQAEKVSDNHPQVMSTKRAMSRMMRR